MSDNHGDERISNMSESSMRGKICLVTGSTSGMGKVTARELASRGATVVLVGRNRQKGEATQAEIRRETGNENVDLLIQEKKSSRRSYDQALGQRLWQVSEQLAARAAQPVCEKILPVRTSISS